VQLHTLIRTLIYVEDSCLNPKLFVVQGRLLAARQRGVQDRWAVGTRKGGSCLSTLLKAHLQLVQNQTNMDTCNMISCKYRLESYTSVLVTVPLSRSWDSTAWCDPYCAAVLASKI